MKVGSEPLAQVDMQIRQGATTSWVLNYEEQDSAGVAVAQDFSLWLAK